MRQDGVRGQQEIGSLAGIGEEGELCSLWVSGKSSAKKSSR